MRLVTKLNQERQQPVILIAWACDDSLSDFALNGHHHSFRATYGVRQFDQYRRGDGIREVGHQLPIAPVARFALQELQGVVVLRGQVGRGGETLRQEFEEPPVLLNRQDFSGLGEQHFRQRPQSRTDLQHAV